MKTGMIKPLTSLRFVFALMVFVSHFEWIQNEKFKYFFELYFKEGYFGVSFFFVLSGFILALNYKGKPIKLTSFYVARFSRIYPVYIFTLLLIIPLVMWSRWDEFYDWSVKLLLNIFCLQSFVPDMNYYFSFNAPAWSVSVEIFFYAMFPLLIRFNGVYLKILFLLIACAIIYVIPFADYYTAHAFFYVSPAFRIVDFFIGICLFDIFEHKPMNGSKFKWTLLEIASILLFAVFFAFHSDTIQGYRYSVYYWIPIIFILYVFANNKGFISVLISNKILVLLGEISFGFYLIHQIVIRYFREYNGKYQIISSDAVSILLIFFVSLILSYATYRLIEVPARLFIKGLYGRKHAKAPASVQTSVGA